MKLILFDLDGTLADSLQDLADSCNYALQQNGFPIHPVADYRYLVGQGVDRLLLDASPEYAHDAQQQAALKQAFRQYYHEHFLDATRLYPGISAMLETLHHTGYQMGLLSNKPDAFVTLIVESLSLSPYLDAYVGQRDGIARKPDPTAALQMIKQLGCSAADTCYVGDSNVDIQTAQNAGIRSIGVSWGFRGRTELEQSGADDVVDTPAQLTALLTSIFTPQSKESPYAN